MSTAPEDMVESSLRTHSLLYRAVTGALPDALSDKIRPGLIPYEDGIGPGTTSADPNPSCGSMLQLVLLRSAVLNKTLDDTGCIAVVDGTNIERPGVERLVKLCFGLALREGAGCV